MLVSLVCGFVGNVKSSLGGQQLFLNSSEKINFELYMKLCGSLRLLLECISSLTATALDSSLPMLSLG